LDEKCGHEDCAQTRKQAAAVCPYCKKAIGYDQRFFTVAEDGPFVDYFGMPIIAVAKSAHAVCHYEELERVGN
jgi:hypothetical protein